MIVIVEGIDRVGKTTLCRALEEKGFIYIKDFSPRANTKEEEDAKLLTYASTILCVGRKHNVVVDRMHMTEFVYGLLERGYISEAALKVDQHVGRQNNVKLVYMIPTDLNKSSEEHGRGLDAHDKIFRALWDYSDISSKRVAWFEKIPEVVAEIMEEFECERM
jgi:thymidylate kinase